MTPFKVLWILACSAWLVAGEHYDHYEPSYGHAEQYVEDHGHHQEALDHHGHHEEHHEAKPYSFGYAVKDHHHGTDFDQHESSDGHNVKGQYRVKLPDGRTQIVTYHADWKNGFHADVQYEGEAHYPEPSPHKEYHHSSSADYSSHHVPSPDYSHQAPSHDFSHQAPSHDFSHQASSPDFSSHGDFGGYSYPEPSSYSSEGY